MNPIEKQTPLQKLHKTWPQLTPGQRKKLVYMAILLSVRTRLRALRPIDLLIPVTIAQFALFALVAWMPSRQAVIDAAAGNILIAGLAMLPVTFAKYHQI